MSIDNNLKVEDIARGSPTMFVPTFINFSEDGKLLTYVHIDGNGSRLFHKIILLSEHIISTTTSNFTELQISKTIPSQPSSFCITTKRDGATLMLMTCGNSLLVSELSDSENELSYSLIYDGFMGNPIDAKWSPDGTMISLVLERDLYVIDTPTFDKLATANDIRRLTYEGEVEGISCGIVDFLTKEEMDRYVYLSILLMEVNLFLILINHYTSMF